MNRPHFRRHPRPTDPEPTRDWLDWQGVGLPGATRYDAEWPDVLAAEAPGGDLAAMAAPLPGMDYRHLSAAELADATAWAAAWLDEHRLNILPADQSGFTDWGEYDITPWPGHLVARVVDADAEVDLPMVRAAATAYDLGLPVPLRSDPPIYRACLAEFAGAVAA